ncbi:Deaminated glutathione amidase [bioreactor metagenome]|uniref:Deaminated glutathione amidase n=1 Tax=bioreactor metagenome TaxID=1076179 RepID=A0A644SVP1_9ZZZZ|nr:carbon-nitrogen hydrolase family protein [Negativicutes bacterium]
MPDMIKMALCQPAVVDNKAENLHKAAEMVRRAAKSGCQIAVLPEMFNCPYQSELFPSYAESFPNGETIRLLARLAKEENIVIVGGSIPEKDGERVYNTSFIFAENGELIGRHRKLHLFDVDIKAGTVFKESDTLTAGNDITVVTACGVKLGIGICYDIRFIELAREMTDRGAQVLIYPAAFGLVTGPAHWELLMKARAIDNQVFVIGAAPARTLGAKYQAYGHSIAVDPWGRIVAEADETESLLTIVLDLKTIASVREELPILKHRRPKIYHN